MNHSLPPPADDAAFAAAPPDRSLNARFVDYLDAVFPPSEQRRRQAVSTLSLALAVVVFVASLVSGFFVTMAWALTPLSLLVGIRSVQALRRIRKTQRYFARLRGVARSGELVTAYIVQASDALYQTGSDTLPCLALFTFQAEIGGDAAYMRYLARRIAHLKDTMPPDADGRYVARLARHEQAPVPYRRRLLPLSFTDGSTIYCADLWVKRAYLDTPYLTTDILPCLAEPGETGGIEMIPTWLLSPAGPETSRPESGSSGGRRAG